MDSFQAYRDAARKDGVPEHAIDLALRLARPQIEFSATSEGGGVLAGRYGGLPPLPPGAGDDDGADLIASVDCAALPQGGLDLPLPSDGNLLFFANNSDSDEILEDIGRVVYVPAAAVTAERTPDGDAEYTDPRPLYARTVWSLPTAGDDAVVVDDEARRVYEEHELEDSDDREGFWKIDLLLGGYAYSPQDPPIMGASPDDERGGWVLLAQARYEMRDDSGFTGCPFWIIRRDDLAELDFDAARVVMWSHH
ncbi:DUF1963 domain-containing protein [Nocardiopsis aegyptia]|uniref:DUF1963 domain-containing protein n=1 Tax=Nocardiopsis aegyptia TaxID=220378 RepID=A0A7Z0J8I9_9ACTN|nr:DUF1963 domain-containing protein [Nocardiopsis aegyptia]NYJ32777.1 hypothetical protein [Nocardiopsis aegyptia]